MTGFALLVNVFSAATYNEFSYLLIIQVTCYGRDSGFKVRPFHH